ncbi:MAG: hypothetical protein K8S62_09715 [Candidatus Sabulitectum sp.]|nr:hypothetical protein [Candidatus Sabulitectum sp.]
MRFFVFVAMCLVSLAGAVGTGFPEDPAGVDVIDRAYYRGFTDGGEVLLYIRLFNNGNQGTVELLNGTPADGGYKWELIYSWQPALYDGSPLTLDQVSVISVQSCDNRLLITWIDRLYSEYIEGLGSLYLEYDLESGEIGETLED